MKHFGCIQNTPSVQCSGSLIPSSNIPAHSWLVVSSSGRAVFIFHWDVGASIISVFTVFVVSQQLWQHLLLRPSLTCRRQRAHPSLHRTCHSHLWQTASCRRMFSLFPWSQHGCSHENTSECFMSPCRRQKILTRHKKLAHRGIPQKREPRDEWWRLTERERERCECFHIWRFLDVLLYTDCSGWRPWNKEWFLLNCILLKWKSTCEKSESHKNNTWLLLGNRYYYHFHYISNDTELLASITTYPTAITTSHM